MHRRIRTTEYRLGLRRRSLKLHLTSLSRRFNNWLKFSSEETCYAEVATETMLLENSHLSLVNVAERQHITSQNFIRSRDYDWFEHGDNNLLEKADTCCLTFDEKKEPRAAKE